MPSFLCLHSYVSGPGAGSQRLSRSHTLFRNDGQGTFTDVTVEGGLSAPTLPYVGFGVVFSDVDNSGQLDLAIVNGHVIDNTALFRAGSTQQQPKLLFWNTGRRFLDIGKQAGPGFAGAGVGRALIAGDYHNDGDVDLLVTNNGASPDLLRNEGGNRAAALVVRLAGTRSNRDGIGARIAVTEGGRTQTREVKSGSSYLGQNDLRAHFGLGQATQVDRLEVRWTSGQVDRVEGVEVNHVVTIQEGTGVTNRTPLARR